MELTSIEKGFMIVSIICIGIAKYVGMPLLIGAGLTLVVGVPVGVLAFLPYFFLMYAVSPVLRAINKITILGRIVTSLFAIVVSVPVAVAIFVLLVVPEFLCLAGSLEYGSSVKGTMATNFPFWCWFDWAFRWLDMGHVWPGGDEMLMLGMLKCILLAPFLMFINCLPLLGALGALGWGAMMVFKPDD